MHMLFKHNTWIQTLKGDMGVEEVGVNNVVQGLNIQMAP